MQLNNEEIRVLMIEKIAGSIEPADDLIIEQLIADNPAVREMWVAISAELQEAESGGFIIHADEQEQWNRLEPLLEKKPSAKIRTFVTRLTAAASVIAVVAMGFRWLHPEKVKQDRSKIVSGSARKLKAPTLEFPGHELVELPGNEHKKFRIGDVVFETDGRKLSYTAPAGDKQSWTLSIPAGSDYKVELSDGTEVWLNAASSLNFPANFNATSREIFMQGEAFFKVAENKQRPFIVHASTMEVLVTGTQFNVNTYNIDKIQTALVEGSVILRNKNSREVKLKPGFEAEFTSQHGFETHRFDSLEVLSWMNGICYFRNRPLKELSELIRRWYDVDIEFSDRELEHKTFSGELRKDQPLQFFLENLTLSGDVHGQLKEGKVYFR